VENKQIILISGIIIVGIIFSFYDFLDVQSKMFLESILKGAFVFISPFLMILIFMFFFAILAPNDRE
jgi:hypothetical protein